MPTGVYKRTKEYRQIMSDVAKKGNYGKWMKGRKRSQKTIDKFRESHSLEKHWNWKGGLSFNPTYRSWSKNSRNRKKKAALGSHTYGEWQILKCQYNFTCLACKKSEPEIQLTEDHIIPLSKGGSNNIENIQPLCKSCNCKKNAKIINYINQ